MKENSQQRVVRLVLLGVFGLLSAPVGAAGLSLELGGEYMRWEEFAGGGRLLEEQGMRTRMGLSWSGDGSGVMSWNLHLGTYLGQISYRGRDWLGTPVGTNTTYIGLEGEVGVSLNRMELFGMQPGVGLGFDLWSRDINGPGGYTEHYSLYDLSVRLTRRNDTVGSYGYHFGINRPLGVNEQTYVLGSSIDLKPDPRPMLNFGLSYRFTDNLNLKFDYLGFRFGISPPSEQTVPFDSNGDGIVEQVSLVQPQSNLDRFAITMQIEF